MKQVMFIILFLIYMKTASAESFADLHGVMPSHDSEFELSIGLEQYQDENGLKEQSTLQNFKFSTGLLENVQVGLSLGLISDNNNFLMTDPQIETLWDFWKYESHTLEAGLIVSISPRASESDNRYSGSHTIETNLTYDYWASDLLELATTARLHYAMTNRVKGEVDQMRPVLSYGIGLQAQYEFIKNHFIEIQTLIEQSGSQEKGLETTTFDPHYTWGATYKQVLFDTWRADLTYSHTRFGKAATLNNVTTPSTSQDQMLVTISKEL